MSPDGAQVYVGDAGNNRVLRFAGEAHAAPPPPAPPAPVAAPVPPPAATPAPPPRDTTAPAIGAPRLAAARVSRRRTVLPVRLTLSEAATVRLTVEARRGRRWVARTAVVRSAPRGARRLTASLRRRGKPLATGEHRVVVRAVDPAGNRAPARTVRFRIVR